MLKLDNKKNVTTKGTVFISSLRTRNVVTSKSQKENMVISFLVIFFRGKKLINWFLWVIEFPITAGNMLLESSIF